MTTGLSYPFSRLFIGPEKTVVVSGPHIQVLDSSTGETLHSTLQFTSEQQERDAIIKSGVIRCAVVDETFTYLAEVGEDKLLKLWEVDGLKLVNSRELPKKPTSIVFTKDSQTVLVSDKFGDVFSYPLVYTPFTSSELEEQKQAKEKDPFASHTNPSNGSLILGHVSPLNAMLLSSDENFIITADRDEHIRVSWYPQGFNIEMYCLGHLKFVSALHIPSSDTKTLISGGGDPVIKLWDWMTGQEMGDLPVAEAIEPFIVIRKVLGRHQGADGEDNEGGAAEGGSGKSKKAKRKKGKGQAQQQKAKEPAEGEEEDTSMAVDESGPADPAGVNEDASISTPVPQKILAIRRIETLTVENAATFILFSAIGSTALFSAPYPSSLSATQLSSPPSLSSAELQHIDFKQPIIDFVVLPTTSSSVYPSAFVTLDSSWGDNDESTPETSHRVRLVTVSSSGKLTEVDGERRQPYASLLEKLNGSATDVPASEKELKSLDLYSELVSLPKYVEKPSGSEGVPGGEGDGEQKQQEQQGQQASGNLTKRKLGRLRRTAKVEEAKQKVGGSSARSETGDLPEARDEEEDNDNAEEGPESKRARPSTQNAEEHVES